MATATQVVSTAPMVITESMQRLVQVRDLWTRSQKDQLEIGRLLYEERKERFSVGGRGIHEGFAAWCQEAGIPHASAYRRIAEYEVSIGEREEKPIKKPVSSETSLAPTVDETNPAPDAEELAALLAQPESKPEPASEPIEAPATEILPPQSDTVRLRQLFKGTGIEVKQSIHGNKFLLDGLSFAQCREIATMLVGE
jgi:hypothetical protein